LNVSVGIGFNPVRCFWWTEYYPSVNPVPTVQQILVCTNVTQCGYGRITENPMMISQAFAANYTPLVTSPQINLYVVCYNDMPTSNFPSAVVNAWQFSQATNNTSNIVTNTTTNGSNNGSNVVTNNSSINGTTNGTTNNTTNGTTNKSNNSSSSIIQISYALFAMLGLFLVLLN